MSEDNKKMSCERKVKGDIWETNNVAQWHNHLKEFVRALNTIMNKMMDKRRLINLLN